jgi:MT-A70
LHHGDQGQAVINLTNQTTVIASPMREHSRKPDEFYAMVDSLCVGRKLDYFSREPREGRGAVIRGWKPVQKPVPWCAIFEPRTEFSSLSPCPRGIYAGYPQAYPPKP